jgi:hypothetical protein
MDVVVVPVLPSAPRTVSVAVNVWFPELKYVCWAVLPVHVLPSPNAHS